LRPLAPSPALGASLLFLGALALLTRRASLLKRALALLLGALPLGCSSGAAFLAPTAAPGAGRLLLALLLGPALLLLATLALRLLILSLSALLLLFLPLELAALLADTLASLTPALELRRERFRGGRDRGLRR